MEKKPREPALFLHGTVLHPLGGLGKLLDSEGSLNRPDDIALVSHHVRPGKSDDPLAFEGYGVVPSAIAFEALTRGVPLSAVNLDDQVVSGIAESRACGSPPSPQ